VRLILASEWTFHMNRARPIGNALAIIIGLAFAGGLGGCIWFNIATYSLPSGSWQPINLAQEQAVQILGATYSVTAETHTQVYVQTNADKVYACDAVYAGGCVDAPPDQLPDAFVQSAGTTTYVAPAPPGEVTRSLVFKVSGLCGGDVKVIILNDGRVWKWNRIECEWGGLAIIGFAFWGVVIGATAGVVLLVINWYWGQRKAARTIISQ
jgi:hypothetical protein